MTDHTIPMPSAKIAAGIYHVLGTTHEVVVQRVAELEGTGYGNNGWHLIVNGEWWQTFPTKREALQACQRHPEL